MTDRVDLMIPGPAGRLSVRTLGPTDSKADVIVLVQGANISGQASYDFTFDVGDDYSLMEAMAARGMSSVTFSLRGYANSELDGDPLSVQTDQTIEDLAAVFDWLGSLGVKAPHLLGWSWGGRIVGRFVETNPDRVDRLVLLDPALGGGQLILPAPSEGWWDNTYDYFLNLEKEFTELAARQALAELISKTEPKSPNGIRVENANGSIAVDPAAISRPTLMIYGSGAGKQAYMHGSQPRSAFFEALATGDKALVIVPGGGDYGHMQNPRRLFHKAVADFLQTPVG